MADGCETPKPSGDGCFNGWKEKCNFLWCGKENKHAVCLTENFVVMLPPLILKSLN
jgi:hypothetical protein